MISSGGTARAMDVAGTRRARRLGVLARPQPAATGQGGFTLIETLIALALAGTVIMAIAAGMLTLVGTTGSTAQRQQIQLALGSYTESLKAAGYIDCGDVTAYDSEYVLMPAAWTPDRPGMAKTLKKVEFWNGTTFVSSPTAAGCPAADPGVQRLTVEVTLGDGVGEAQVVKGDR